MGGFGHWGSFWVPYLGSVIVYCCTTAVFPIRIAERVVIDDAARRFPLRCFASYAGTLPPYFFDPQIRFLRTSIYTFNISQQGSSSSIIDVHIYFFKVMYRNKSHVSEKKRKEKKRKEEKRKENKTKQNKNKKVSNRYTLPRHERKKTHTS